MDSAAAKGILAALAECLPAEADLGKVEIQEKGPRIVVTLWTSTPGVVIGRGGSTASRVRERLRAAVPGMPVEFHVVTGADRAGPRDRPLDKDPGSASAGRDLVPDLLGMTVSEAYDKARSCGFWIATGDQGGVPISFHTAHHEHGAWVIVAQSPLPGVLAPCHSQIAVDIEERGGGGESGDREPRLPRPPGGIARFEQPLGLQDLEYARRSE